MIQDLEHFLRLAAILEADAAEGYTQLARTMRLRGDGELASMFEQFGEFSRLHLSSIQARQRAEFGHILPLTSTEADWPEEYSPENPLAVTHPDDLTPRKAVENALETERRACDFYSVVANQTRCERVQELAQEFAEEEAEHVEHLERWLARINGGPKGEQSPTTGSASKS